MPGTGWGVRRFTKRDGDPAIGLAYFYGVRSAILDRIHKGERADLPVQALTKVSCHQSKDCQGRAGLVLARADEVIE
jgi:hypothetical protein